MYKKIHVQMLYHLTEHTVTMTSVALAKLLERSARTVKNEMRELKVISRDFGVEITSRRGKGYRATIFDEDLFLSMYEKHLVVANYYEHSNNASAGRADYIISLLLSSDRVLTLDDIEAAMYLSRNSFKEELRQAIAYLQSFNIIVENSPSRGISLQGSEESYRMALTQMFGVHFNSYEVATLEPTLEMYEIDYYQRQSIRHEFMDVLRDKALSISDDATQFISVYLVVAINRIRNHKELNLQTTCDIVDTPHYGVARVIATKIETITNIHFNDQEILVITKLLIANSNNYNYYTEDFQFFALKKKEARTLLESMKDTSRPFFEMSVDHFEGLQQTLECILINAEFGYIQHSLPPLRKRYIPFCQVSTTIAHSLKTFIEKTYHIEIADSFRNHLEKSVMFLIDAYELKHQKASIAVVSTNGKQYAKNVSTKIKKRLRSLVTDASYYELYELRGKTTDALQLVVSDIDEAFYRYTIPHYSMSGNELSLDDYRSISIILVKYMYQIFDDLLDLEFNFSESLAINTISELSKMLSYRYTSKNFDTHNLYEYIQNYFLINRIDTDTEVVILEMPNHYDGEAFIDVYSHPTQDGVHYVMVIHLGTVTPKILKYLTIIIRALSANYEVIQQWEQTRDFSVLFDQIAEQILIEGIDGVAL
ncbi:PRD domain-containing protein [Erysipelothrix sp. HDW6C]|uniref:BglG family transcription antiterminator n=1 Tax=Erysipelothrix sp. HDW6C TaxID=2714930 RepID=UPI00140A0C0A|nr:PRD domain-containing protein [Erysipelothrix sp. HDW6C]QIK68837.1 PRD domain-containing protein [Erysipelothrix sp. HDW6C]